MFPLECLFKKWFGLANDDVAWSVSLGVESSQLEKQVSKTLFFSPKFNELFQNILNLFLKYVVLQENDSLRLEDFVLDDFSTALNK